VPILHWHEVYEKSVIAKGPTINFTSKETERLEILVNRHILHDKEEVKCTGLHVTGVEKSCSFNLGKSIFSYSSIVMRIIECIWPRLYAKKWPRYVYMRFTFYA